MARRAKGARARHHRPTDCEHLLFAAAERPARAIRQLFETREESIHLLQFRVNLVSAPPPRERAQFEILPNGETRKNPAPFRHMTDARVHNSLRRPARDALTAEVYLPFGAQQSADDAQRRRLARAVGADQRDDLTLAHGQRKLVERAHAAVVGVNVLQFENRCPCFQDTPRSRDCRCGWRPALPPRFSVRNPLL